MNQAAKDLLKKGAEELGLSLSNRQLASLDLFAEELKKWNRKINLTAITNDQDIAVKHLVDSLSLLKVVHDGGRLLDIGSGGGFPCIPVKIALPALDVFSVDAVVKKISFQKQAARLLNLSNFEAAHVRAETLAATHAGSFDWIVSRAFSEIPMFVEMSLPLLKNGGRIIAMKGRKAAEEVAEASEALSQMGAEVEKVVEFALPCSGEARALIVMVKSN